MTTASCRPRTVVAAEQRTELGEDRAQAILADAAAVGGAALADPIGVQQEAVPGTHLSAEDREHALGEPDAERIGALAVELVDTPIGAQDQRRWDGRS